jgi:hypothetical protein
MNAAKYLAELEKLVIEAGKNSRAQPHDDARTYDFNDLLSSNVPERYQLECGSTVTDSKGNDWKVRHSNQGPFLVHEHGSRAIVIGREGKPYDAGWLRVFVMEEPQD